MHLALLPVELHFTHQQLLTLYHTRTLLYLKNTSCSDERSIDQIALLMSLYLDIS